MFYGNEISKITLSNHHFRLIEHQHEKSFVNFSVGGIIINVSLEKVVQLAACAAGCGVLCYVVCDLMSGPRHGFLWPTVK